MFSPSAMLYLGCFTEWSVLASFRLSEGDNRLLSSENSTSFGTSARFTLKWVILWFYDNDEEISSQMHNNLNLSHNHKHTAETSRMGGREEKDRGGAWASSESVLVVLFIDVRARLVSLPRAYVV